MSRFSTKKGLIRIKLTESFKNSLTKRKNIKKIRLNKWKSKFTYIQIELIIKSFKSISDRKHKIETVIYLFSLNSPNERK